MLAPFRVPRLLVAVVFACAPLACPAADPSDNDTTNDTTGDTTDDDDQSDALPVGVFGIDVVAIDDADSTADLEPFFAATADADVIGLGESVHTSGGFYALKERLIRAIVDEQGVRVLAIETPRTAAKVLDAYVLGAVDPGDAPCSEVDAVRAAQTGVFAVFVDDHFISMLMSLCTFNQAHVDDPVHIYGVDAQQPELDAAAIAAYLQEHAPNDADRLLAALTTCLTSPVTLETTPEAYNACVDGLSAMTAYLDAHADVLSTADADALATFRIDLLSFASWQDEAFFFETDTARSYEVRDVAMGAIFLDAQARFFPGERVALWAHDYHLSMAHDQAAYSFPIGATTLGTVLHDTLGPRYQAFAISAVEIAINWPNVGTGVQPRGQQGVEDEVADLLVEGTHEAVLLGAASAQLQDGERNLGLMFSQCALGDNFSGIFVLRSSPSMDATYW